MTSVSLNNLPQRKYLKASEIAQYNFCSLSWYLQRIGCKPQPTKLEKGAKYHEEIGLSITEMEEERNSSYKFFILASVFLIAAIIIFLLGGLL